MLETRRLIIRPYNNSDIYSLFDTINRNEIYQTTYGIPLNCNLRYAKRWIKAVANNFVMDKSYEYAIINKSDNKYMGNVGLININKECKKCDISYFIHPNYWNMGIATEASIEMVKYAFINLSMERVGGSCMAHNIASARVMQKLLMKYEGTLRNYLIKDGLSVSLSTYSILKDEFFKYYSKSE